MFDSKKIADHISHWLKDYAVQCNAKGFVIGISGGIDSALTSTLCAQTGMQVLCLEMPIHQAASQVTRAQEHISWLKAQYANVKDQRIELTETFEQLRKSVDTTGADHTVQLALANARARLRMTTLYYYAGMHGLLVAGTGNKVEDFGIGFFTKYGDGGVDLSPIADLTKTEVYTLSTWLGIAESILHAAPTDGLFGDSRTDEQQIGASYAELEWAMRLLDSKFQHSDLEWPTATSAKDLQWADADAPNLTDRQKEVVKIYIQRHLANRHKMVAVPVCVIPKGWT
ncbi:MAG: NAD(+) synthase [Flavobacteriales bacterium]